MNGYLYIGLYIKLPALDYRPAGIYLTPFPLFEAMWGAFFFLLPRNGVDD
jgi:hypothetical protein